MEIFQRITDQIVDFIDSQDFLPWSKPWSIPSPQNAITGNSYRGVNRLVLSLTPFSDPRFLTYKQAQNLGGSVRKGEKGTPIVFWCFDHKGDDSEDWQPNRFNSAPIKTSYTVFNVGQCDGLNLPEIPVRQEVESVKAAIKKVIDGFEFGPKIFYRGEIACYIPINDTILMPRREQFESGEDFASVLAHELIHSTSHKDRLNRFGDGEPVAFGSESYSFEELIAQIGASFLCSEAGIGHNLQQSAAYVRGWLQVLRGDKSMIPRAAAHAQKACDLILGRIVADSAA